MSMYATSWLAGCECGHSLGGAQHVSAAAVVLLVALHQRVALDLGSASLTSRIDIQSSEALITRQTRRQRRVAWTPTSAAHVTCCLCDIRKLSVVATDDLLLDGFRKRNERVPHRGSAGAG